MAEKFKNFWERYFERCYQNALEHLKNGDDYEAIL